MRDGVNYVSRAHVRHGARVQSGAFKLPPGQEYLGPTQHDWHLQHKGQPNGAAPIPPGINFRFSWAQQHATTSADKPIKKDAVVTNASRWRKGVVQKTVKRGRSSQAPVKLSNRQSRSEHAIRSPKR